MGEQDGLSAYVELGDLASHPSRGSKSIDRAVLGAGDQAGLDQGRRRRIFRSQRRGGDEGLPAHGGRRRPEYSRAAGRSRAFEGPGGWRNGGQPHWKNKAPRVSAHVPAAIAGGCRDAESALAKDIRCSATRQASPETNKKAPRGLETRPGYNCRVLPRRRALR